MPEPRDPQHQSPVDYRLNSLIYMPNGQEEAEENVTLALSVFSVEIYENLERPFLSGAVIIRDDAGVYDRLINFNGTERFLLTFSTPTGDNVLSKRFVVKNIANSKKSDETTEIIIIRMVEEVYFLDTVSRFSRAYTGSPDKIISNIIKNELKKEVKVKGELPYQEAMKVVIPNWTAFQASNWIKNRATTEFGFPYYLYATLFDDNIQFKSLETMFKEEAWNDKLFTYSQAHNNQNSSLTDDTNLFNIMDFKQINNEDTIALMEAGSVGSAYTIVDATTGVSENFRFDIKEFFKDTILPNNLLGPNTADFRPVIDNETKFGEDSFTINEKDGNTYERIVAANTYNGGMNNYYFEKNLGGYNKEATAKALRNIVTKSSAQIQVGGTKFFSGDQHRTIGTKIEVYFPNNNSQAPITTEYDMKDLKRSGEYIINSCKHTFSSERHIIDASIMKLGNLKS